MFYFSLIFHSEIGNIPESNFVRDGTNTKSVCTFLSETAKLLPRCVMANMNIILSRLDEEVRCYEEVSVNP